MTSEEQLARWVQGISIHNDDRGECCPDFSCCQKGFTATKEERELFASRPDVRDSMLMMFLGKALSTLTDKNVHIAGDEVTGRAN